MSNTAIDRALIRIDDFPAYFQSLVQLLDVVAMETKQNRDNLERAASVLAEWVEASKQVPTPLRNKTVAFLNEIAHGDPSS